MNTTDYYWAQTPVRQGWICPKCHKGISPDIQVCPCIPLEFMWTTTGTGTGLGGK